MRLRCPRLLSAFILFAISAAAHGATHVATVLIDADVDAATGCVSHGLAGYEHRLVTTTTDGSSSSSLSSCTDGVFGAPAGGGSTWPATAAVESSISQSGLGSANRRTMRFAFVLEDGTATTIYSTLPDGGEILYPPVSGARRRAAAPADGSQNIVVDGLVGDWARVEPLFHRALHGIWITSNDTEIFFRFDLRTESAPPLAVDDAFAVRQGQLLVVPRPGVLGNDSDPDGDTLTATLSAPATHGSLALAADGSFVYLNDGTLADDSFEYKATDGAADSNAARVTINVVPATSPVARDDAYAVASGGTLELPRPGVLLNDSDADGDALAAQVVTGPLHGALTLRADGSFTYVHDGSGAGIDTFTYAASDGVLSSAAATVRITVTASNQPPVAVDDVYAVAHGGTLSVSAPGLFANDSDPDTPPAQWSAEVTTAPGHGTLILGAGGAFTYEHDGGGATADLFAYRISDGSAISNIATVTIGIGAANNAPVAAADQYQTGEDTGLQIAAPGLLANDSDVEGSPLTASATTLPANGTLTLGGDGSFTYTPAADFNGADSFTYTVSDGSAEAAPATVTIVVASINDPPSFAGDGNVTGLEDEAFAAAWAGAISAGPPDEAGQTLSFAVVGNDNTALFAMAPAVTPGGVLTFTPAPNASGSAAITVRLQDSGGTANGGSDHSADVTFNVSVTAVNDPPVAVDDGGASYVVAEGGTLAIAAPGLLANDTDIDGPALLAVSTNTTPARGTAAVSADGSLVYTHDGSETASDTFEYGVTDGAGVDFGSVSITVTPVNDAPVAAADAAATAEDTDVLIPIAGLLANDSAGSGESSQTVTFTGASGAVNGSVSIAGADVRFSPAPDFTGAASFHYSIVDDGTTGGAADPRTATGTVTITVTAVNDAPTVTAPAALTTNEDTPIAFSGQVSVDDVDDGGAALTLTLTLSNGGRIALAATPGVTITNNDTASVTAVGPESGLDAALATAVYTPAANLSGSETLSIAINDGALSGSANVAITIDAINDPPVAGDDSYTIGEDLLLTVNVPGVLAGDTDADFDALTVSLGSNVTNGTLALNADGSFTYQGNPNFAGTDVFTYIVSDGNGGTDTGQVTITVNGVNDAPAVTAPAALTTNEDTPIAFSGQVSVEDVDDGGAAMTLTLTLSNGGRIALAATPGVTITNNDTASVTAIGPESGLDAALATAVYTPAANLSGSETLAVTIDDGALSGSANVTITIDAINDPPVAGDDSYTIGEDLLLTVNVPGVLAGDTDADLHALTVSLGSNVTNGTLALAADGSFTYQGNPNFAGIDVFTYVVSDGNGGTDSGQVTITVNGVNDAPTVTAPAALTTNEDTPIAFSGQVSVDDVDDGGAAMTLTLTLNNGGRIALAATPDVTITNNDTASVTAIGPESGLDAALATAVYTPAANLSGSETLAIAINDGALSGSANVTITIDPLNDPPVAGDDSYTIGEELLLTVNVPGVLAGDTDADLHALTVSLASNVTNGTLALNADGSFTYEGNPNFAGTDTFTYIVSDGNGGTDSGEVTITVTSFNDAPVASDDVYQYPVSGTLSVPAPGILANDTDAEAPGGLTVDPAPAAAPARGNVTLGADGSFLYTRTDPANVAGDAFTYTVSDGTLTDTAVVTILFNAPPAADDDALTTPEDVPLTIAGADLLNGDADPQGIGTIAKIIVVSGPSAGSFSGLAGDNSIAAGGSFLYTPAADQNTPVTFTYKLEDDGGLQSGAATVTINVTTRNDEPFFTPSTLAISVPEDGGAEAISWASGMRPGPVTATDEAGQVLGFVVTPAANAVLGAVTVNASTGVMAFQPVADANGTVSASAFLQDDGGTANGGDDTYQVDFTIEVRPVNDAPAFTKGIDVSVLEDAASQTFSGWATGISRGPANESAQTLTFELSASPNLFSILTADPATGNLTVRPAAGAVGTSTVTIRLKDNGGTADGGDDTSNDQTFTITVTEVNDAPSFTKGADQAVLEDSGPRVVNPWATAISAGPGEGTQTVSFNVSCASAAGFFSAVPAVSSAGTLTFTPAANAFGSRTCTITATDNGGTANGGVNTSPSQSFIITVTSVNDPPAFTVPASAPTVVKNAAAQTVTSFATSITKGAANETADVLTFTLTNDNNGLFSVQPAIGATGTLTYTPAANMTGTATVTVFLKDNGGTANGGSDTSATTTFTITVAEPNVAPNVPNRSLNTYTNMPLTIGPSNSGYRLLDNITDPNGTTTFTLSGVSSVFNGASVQILDSALGTFKFTPAPGVTGNQTFVYRVCDTGFSGQPAACANGTVTVAVSGPNIIFIDDNAAPGGNGTLDKPFQALPNGGTDDPVTYFVYSGTYTRTGAMSLGQFATVYGQGGGGDFDTVFGINPATIVAGSLPPRPSLTGTRPVVTLDVTFSAGGTGRAPFQIWTSMPWNPAGSVSIRHVVINSPNAACFNGGGPLSLTIDNVTMNGYNGLYGISRTTTVTNSSISGTYYALYHLDTSSGPPGASVTFTNTPVSGTRVYVSGNGSDQFVFNSAVTAEHIELIRSSVTFNGPVTATTSTWITIPFAVSVEHAVFNNTLTINSTAPAAGLHVVSGGSIVATANNNSITTSGERAISFRNVTIPAAGVKFQTLNVSNGTVLFEDVGGPGTVTVSGGTVTPCVTRINSPNIVLPGGMPVCP